MPNAVYKYILPFGDYKEILMPEDADIIHAAFQDETPDSLAIWAIVDTTSDTMNIFGFHLVRTGREFISDVDEENHIKTMILDGFVWHLFENSKIWNEDPAVRESIKQSEIRNEEEERLGKCTFCKIDLHKDCTGCNCTDC